MHENNNLGLFVFCLVLGLWTSFEEDEKELICLCFVGFWGGWLLLVLRFFVYGVFLDLVLMQYSIPSNSRYFLSQV